MTIEPATPITRRVAIAGCCVAGTAFAAGCASGNASQAGPARVSLDGVEIGGGTVVAEQRVVVTQPTAGVYKAFSAVCTHQGCSVTNIIDGIIECPCHGSKFSIGDGSVVRGPAQRPLPERPVTIEGGFLTVR